jgi:septum formation topological specificity factor MinE
MNDVLNEVKYVSKLKKEIFAIIIKMIENDEVRVRINKLTIIENNSICCDDTKAIPSTFFCEYFE